MSYVKIVGHWAMEYETWYWCTMRPFQILRTSFPDKTKYLTYHIISGKFSSSLLITDERYHFMI